MRMTTPVISMISWAFCSGVNPNLLFLWAEQQRADTLACYGNPRVQAPHLNFVA